MAVYMTGSGVLPRLPDETTLLLIHGEAIEDVSLFGRTVTNHGVIVSSGQSKFGGKSLYFDGNEARLEIENLLMGNGEFTIDCWAYPLEYKSNTIWSHGGTNTSAMTGGGCELYNDGTLIYYCSGFWIRGGSYRLNEWQHIALVGEKNAIKLYHNGVLIGMFSGTYDFGNFIEDIGANASVYGGENFHGYLDEIRVSTVARWKENFVPPTAAYIGVKK